LLKTVEEAGLLFFSAAMVLQFLLYEVFPETKGKPLSRYKKGWLCNN
jgi:hypothetical protein